ncbi:hypothetical protein N0V83_006907 [Neocucurbitaria cava]|uniref:Uncharacterized protein n=1 Tax=Neocucurbitaria cava TaxID=798079 RepID=A0A9W8Y4Z7_9PLEO|nr:hypothetical protein N0V83_006907 [Neocucurbitaria cava]
MGPPTNTPEENTAFLDACIHKYRSLRDVYETLGLFCETAKPRKDPDFGKEEAKELHAEIREIARAFEGRHGNDLQHLKAHLANDDIFSDEIDDLERRYGQAIWGRAGPEKTLSFVEQGGVLEEFNWDDVKHREIVRFYVHCWIVSVVVGDVSSTPRKGKGKGKGKSKTINVPDREQVDIESPARSSRSDRSGPSELPYRAPEPPNMISASAIRGKNAQSKTLHLHKEGQRRNANTEDNASDNIDMGTGPPLKPILCSPTKRKAPGAQDPHSAGKLQKLSREAGTPSIPSGMLQGDVYSVPRSPTLPAGDAPLRSLAERQRCKGGGQNTDATCMPSPRGVTAETETIADDDEAAADAIDQVIHFPFLSEASIPFRYENLPTAGPSGTYRNPFRRDSVIPDAQNDKDGASPEPIESRTTLGVVVDSSAFNDTAAIPPRIISPSPQTWQGKQHRRELFTLLLSYLNGINQFGPDSYDTNAEERMDSLLIQLWALNEKQLRSELGNDFVRLDTALRGWMDMRKRLVAFQTSTGYLEQPGEPWRAYLRRMLDISGRAQLCIAFSELQAPWSDEGGLQYVDRSFDEDLETVFDLLTRVKGCNGAEEFKAIRVFNEALLGWFRDG